MRKALRAFLLEDLGPACRDVSVEALGPAAREPVRGLVRVKAPGVICGLGLIEPLVSLVESLFPHPKGPGIRAAISLKASDGDFTQAGTIVAEISGPTGILLSSERTILNLLQRLSGTATLTRKFVEAVKGTRCRILDTRKTTPGLRSLEKYAVRTGGGTNHRFGLYDMVMLKDNHVSALGGGLSLAVSAARKILGPSLRIEVEAASLREVEAALEAGADMIMLDNMSPEEMKACVTLVAGRVPLEASGGITLETVAAIAGTGVDFISVGALTHSAPSLDISMKIAPIP